MAPLKKTNREWLRDQVDFICDLGSLVGPVRPSASHSYGVHTVLKLAALNHCLGVFLPIARKYIDDYHRFDSAVYVDLFAGCGASKVPDTGEWLAGSPILAAGSRRVFDKIICMEKNDASCDALRERLARFPKRDSVVLNGDCNELVRDLRQSVGYRNPLAFVFVDPEGMETNWTTLKIMSETFPCMDLLLNFSYGAERVLGDLRSGRDVNEQLMKTFAGQDWPMLLLKEDKTAVDFVEAKISEVLGKPVGNKVLIRDLNNRPVYFLLVRVRRTRGGSPFFGAYEDMLGRVNGLGPKEVVGVLNDKFGRSLTASRWNPSLPPTTR